MTLKTIPPPVSNNWRRPSLLADNDSPGKVEWLHVSSEPGVIKPGKDAFSALREAERLLAAVHNRHEGLALALVEDFKALVLAVARDEAAPEPRVRRQAPAKGKR